VRVPTHHSKQEPWSFQCVSSDRALGLPTLRLQCPFLVEFVVLVARVRESVTATWLDSLLAAH
jgi:hypothetical protein